MRRSSPLARRTPLASSRRGTGPTAATVELVLERAGYACEVGGHEIGDVRGVDYSLHHRAPRQAGGTRDPRYNQPANLLVVCGHGTSGCHQVVEQHRIAAYEAGWLVHRGQDPANVPVLLVVDGERRLVLLGPDGRYRELP